MSIGLIRAFAIFGCAGLVLLSGCDTCGDWMPLRKGKTWRYLIKDAAEVMEVKCTEPRRVGDADGWLVSGLGGESTYAWDVCVLRTSRLGSMDFDPPIGILQADKEDSSWKYTGNVTIRGQLQKATAEITQDATSIEDRYPEAMRVRVVLTIGENEIDLITVFARGIGVVEQEQRNNGRTVSRAQLTNDSG